MHRHIDQLTRQELCLEFISSVLEFHVQQKALLPVPAEVSPNDRDQDLLLHSTGIVMPTSFIAKKLPFFLAQAESELSRMNSPGSSKSVLCRVFPCLLDGWSATYQQMVRSSQE